jgi:hypothetical protein
MARTRSAKVLRRIKQCAQDGLILYSDHARLEMNEDAFDEVDVVRTLLRGDLFARQTRGNRGTRYLLQGSSVDGREMKVVCRVTVSGVRVVTVFRI